MSTIQTRLCFAAAAGTTAIARFLQYLKPKTTEIKPER